VAFGPPRGAVSVVPPYDDDGLRTYKGENAAKRLKVLKVLKVLNFRGTRDIRIFVSGNELPTTASQ
jgi:hypothetical protein